MKLPASLSDLLYKLSIKSSPPPASTPTASPLPPSLLIDWTDEASVASLRAAEAAAILSRRVHDEEEKTKRRDEDDLLQPSILPSVSYTDPFQPSLPPRRPSLPRSSSSPSDDDDDRRWTELERREERERHQSRTEEKREPTPSLAPSKAASASRAAPSVARAVKVDFDWLLRRCESFVANHSAAPGEMSPFDLASSALHLLQSSASDERLQSDLLDLLGLEAMDLIAELLSQRAQVKLISKSELTRGPFSLTSFLPTPTGPLPPPAASGSRQAPPQLLGVSVVSQREKELDKARRKEDRRMARHSAKDTSADAVQRQRAVDAQRLEEQATSLDHWRSSSIQARSAALPAGSKRTEHKGYEEVWIPPMVQSPFEQADLIPITELDAWARPTFQGTTHLNRIQSKVFPAAYKHNNNILVCAPTGAGHYQCSPLSTSCSRLRGPRLMCVCVRVCAACRQDQHRGADDSARVRSAHRGWSAAQGLLQDRVRGADEGAGAGGAGHLPAPPRLPRPGGEGADRRHAAHQAGDRRDADHRHHTREMVA